MGHGTRLIDELDSIGYDQKGNPRQQKPQQPGANKGSHQ
jgi:hypothetical protein